MDLRILVYLNRTAFETKKAVFERNLSYSSELVVPYDKILSVMHFLYGENSIVHFQIG